MAIAPRDPLDPRRSLSAAERGRLHRMAGEVARRVWGELRDAFNDAPVMIRPDFEVTHDVIVWLAGQDGWAGTFARPDIAQVVELDIAPWVERLIALRYDLDSGRRAL
jgi:hypothetical protein